MKKVYFFLFIFGVSSLIGIQTGCLSPQLSDDERSPSPDLTSDDWRRIDQNVERRVIKVPLEDSRAEMIIYRLAKDKARLEIHHSTAPQRLDEWAEQLQSLIVINGGYFDEDYNPTGMLVIDGQDISGRSYDLTRSGALVVSDRRPSIIDTADQPLPEQANLSILQSFPLLISNFAGAIKEDSGKLARRTVVAEDDNDNLLVIIVDKTPVSLFELMNLLLESDLKIKIALNLDGGPSTGLIANLAGFSESLLPLSSLPQAISIN